MNVTTMSDEAYIEDPAEDRRSSPYLLFPLTKRDDGKMVDRTGVAEYVRRQPWCVNWADDHLTLTITNLGYVASDLVQVAYQFRVCVDPLHLVDEGFVQPHAGEVANNTTENGGFLNFVPAAQGRKPGSISLIIAFPELPGNLANLYFRAKVTTLWSEPTPPATWSFATDCTVVEATKRYAIPFS